MSSFKALPDEEGECTNPLLFPAASESEGGEVALAVEFDAAKFILPVEPGPEPDSSPFKKMWLMNIRTRLFGI